MPRELEVTVGPACISSGYCRNTAPDVFVLKKPRATVVNGNPHPESPKLTEAMESCPVEAISAKDVATGEVVFP
ncbi:MAG: 4Fe-4S single cluster domain of Ferredoxin [Actinomycetota bacterium]|jgi:ferredoxin|nr:4Fe-4S single cluster domain of Ferredoxin [Actinomycetota bacterium]